MVNGDARPFGLAIRSAVACLAVARLVEARLAVTLWCQCFDL